MLLLAALCTAATALAYHFQSGDLYYDITSYNTVAVTYQEYWSSTNYQGLSTAIIPETVTYNGTTYSVTKIGSSAFHDCSSLTSIIIPNSVTSIGGGTFQGCSSLTSIVVESGNTMYDSRENCNAIIETASNTLIAGCQSTTIPNSVTSIGESAFRGCSSLTSLTIPDSVTSIGNYAFYGCSSLTSVTIPNAVTSIGEQAFKNCSSLAYIYCYATTPPVCDDDNIFSGVNKLCHIHVPAGTITNYQVATGWRYFSKFLEISEETSISETEQQNKSSRKIIRDGQVIILRDGEEYSVLGQKL